MSGESSKFFLTSLSPHQVAALLTIVSSLLVYKFAPLEPRRPMELMPSSSVHGDDHKFNAAHFEDPLAAAARAPLVAPDTECFDASKQVKVSSPWGFFLELRDRIKKRAEPKKRVLTVCALLRQGEELPAREIRGRMRLAVVSALASAGYVPESAHAMECCRLSPWPLPQLVRKEPLLSQTAAPRPEKSPQPPVPNTKIRHLDIPFEWFRPEKRLFSVSDQQQYDSVIVLWVRGEAVVDEPVDGLRKVLFALFEGHPRRLAADGTSAETKLFDTTALDVAILGPPTSDKLLSFIKEAKKLKDQGDRLERKEERWYGPLRLASPYATSSAESLIHAAYARGLNNEQASAIETERELRGIMSNLLKGNGEHDEGRFARIPLTDDYVALALVDELKKRGITFPAAESESGGDIVLISEFNTSYGRELPHVFLKAATGTSNARFVNRPNSRWHWTGYPQGLDGRYSASHSDGGSATKSDPAKNSSEEPLGLQQMDSLRRMASELAELHESRLRQNQPGVVAVGILGGDVYDKMLIIRALRPLLPDSLFFSNNIDAWYWDQQELKTSRHLVVASPFGLTLADRWQAGKPPFRDSYQTSAYAGMLGIALGPPGRPLLEHWQAGPSSEGGGNLQGERVKAVRIYEVGRSRPVDLSFNPGLSEFPDKNAAVRASFIHPLPHASESFWHEPSRIDFLRRLGTVGAVCLLLCLGVFTIYRTDARAKLPILRQQREADPLKNTISAIAMNPGWMFLIPVVTHIVIYVWWYHQRNDGEPLSLTLGVSAWPGIAFLLAACLLCTHLVLKMLGIIWTSERQLREKYFAEPQGPRSTLKRDGQSKADRAWRFFAGWLPLWRVQDIVQPSGSSKKSNEAKVDPFQLYSAFRRTSRLLPRTVRALLLTGLVIFVIEEISQLMPQPMLPVRGAEATALAQWCDDLSMIGFVFLGALVIDSLWLNRVFVNWFGRGNSQWPDHQLGDWTKVSLDRESFRDRLDLLVIADWTRDIGRLTSLPFFVLPLLILARLRYFDDWTWPVGTITGYVIIICLVIFGAYRVHLAAAGLRAKALAEIRDRYSMVQDHKAADLLAAELHGLNHGAFVPFHKQPVMEAFYWLISAFGAGGLWQALSQWR